MDLAGTSVLLIFLIAVALAFDFLNGLHDAANSIATIVSTRVLSPRWAVVWAAIFNFIALWNEFQLALIFIQDPDMRPLSLALYTLKNAMTYSGDWAGLFAGVVIVIVPTVILFIFLSERMISGITLGSVK